MKGRFCHGEFPNSQVTQSLPREARGSIEAVFDALSAWRDEVGESTERYSETVLNKMAAAARALGWPKELVETSHKYLVQASKMQMHVIDQLMDAWQKQLTSPRADQFIAQLRTLPSAGFGATPMDFWIQAADAWQRNWQSALSMWANPTSGSSRH